MENLGSKAFQHALSNFLINQFGIDSKKINLWNANNQYDALKYAEANGLDKFDNEGNPVLENLMSSALKYRDEDHLNQYMDSWQNIVGAHEMQKQDQLEYYSNYVDSLKQAGLNPIMATTGGSLPTVSSANASMSNINAFEFLTKEQNKLNIQVIKSITDIVKRLIPDQRKLSSSAKVKVGKL